MARDDLFHQVEPVEPFTFDKAVAHVFDDMIDRSVPLYRELCEASVQLIVDTAERLNKPLRIYDVGASLGAVTLPLASALRNNSQQNHEIIAIDNSQAMLDELQKRSKNLSQACAITYNCTDAQYCIFENADFIICNYTLQFIDPVERNSLLKKMQSALCEKNGSLIIAEKIRLDDDAAQLRAEQLHWSFKRRHGYSELEIRKKREALEGILMSDSETDFLGRLNKAGFQTCHSFLRWQHFASWIAVTQTVTQSTEHSA